MEPEGPVLCVYVVCVCVVCMCCVCVCLCVCVCGVYVVCVWAHVCGMFEQNEGQLTA